jgi:nitrogen-specific signal transduction histidine kinase/ActR/RegA family two-component response regulator
MRRFDPRAFVRAGCPFPLLALIPSSALRPSPSEGGASATPDVVSTPFFELSADPMIVIDADLRVTDANPAAARYLGMPADKLRGTAVLEVSLLARLLTATSIPQRLRAATGPLVDEVALTDLEGQPLQCRVEAFALPDRRTLLHLQDTTAVLRARAALRSAEMLHHAALEAMPEVGWVMALPEERLLEIGASVERLFGHEPAAFKQHPELFHDLVHPAERERVRDEFRRGLASGRPFDIEFTGLHRDHHDLPHLINRVVPVRDENGWLDRCEGFIEDLGRERSLEATLRAAETHLQHVLESVSSGVLVLTPASGGIAVALCNRRLADLIQLDDAPRPGTPLARCPAALRRLVVGGGQERDYERRLLSEEQREQTLELESPHRVLRRYSGPLRDRLGAVIGRIVTVEDITSASDLQRRLMHAQKMESMGRLAGGVAHDFNNLLGTILGFASLELERTPADDPRHAGLAEIVRAAERGGRLTQTLLAFSRTARYERLPVQLNRVIEDSYEIVRSTLEPSVSLTLDLDPELPTMLGDALLLQQLVVNLAQDARDRVPGDGTLRILTRRERGDAGARRSHPCIVMEVLVEPGTRGLAEAFRPPSDERGGLSLTMVGDIARAHGGYLVASPDPRGVVYQVVFPVEGPEETLIAVPDSTSARGHETILIVDDEESMRTLARVGLQQRGFDPITASGGESALEILRSGKPPVDLVILDLTMPGMPGERVLREIRATWPALPVVIASGYATVESQSSWVAAGAMGFVAKPYRVQDLAAKLREVLDRLHGRVG